MKKIIIIPIAIILCSFYSNPKTFSYNKEGLSPKFAVMEFDSFAQNELFENTVNWIKETYTNPDEVIKMTIPNKKVRIEGSKLNGVCHNALGTSTCYNVTYTLEISFKEDKYKFTPTNLKYRIPATQYYSGGYQNVNFADGSYYYNKKGALRKQYTTVPYSITKIFNDLNNSLNIYLKTNKGKEVVEDDW